MNIYDITCGTILCHKGETYIVLDYSIESDVEVKIVALCASKKLIRTRFVFDNDGKISAYSYKTITDNIMLDYSNLMLSASKDITILTKI